MAPSEPVRRARPAPARAPALALLAALLGLPGPSRAAELPPRRQALLLRRVLDYDRNLGLRGGAVLRVVVLFRPGHRVSERGRDALLAALAEPARRAPAGEPRLEGVAVPYRGEADLAERLRALRPACLYVTSGLGARVAEIAHTARRRAVLTAGGSRELVEGGLAVGLVDRGPRAGVVVNLPAARAEGAALDAALLAIAEVLP